MNPRRYIEELCRRYGVSPDFGFRLQPLVERAGQVDPEKRARLLDLVSRSFEQEAQRAREHRGESDLLRSLPEADRKSLCTVAAILHRWTPPGWLESGKDGGRG